MERKFKVAKKDVYNFRDELNIINNENSELNHYVNTKITTREDYYLITIKGESYQIERLISLSNYLNTEL